MILKKSGLDIKKNVLDIMPPLSGVNIKIAVVKPGVRVIVGANVSLMTSLINSYPFSVKRKGYGNVGDSHC